MSMITIPLRLCRQHALLHKWSSTATFFAPIGIAINPAPSDLATIEAPHEISKILHQHDHAACLRDQALSGEKTPQKKSSDKGNQYLLEHNRLGKAQLAYLPPHLQNIEAIRELVKPLHHPVDDFPAECEDQPTHYQFLSHWSQHRSGRVKVEGYFVEDSEAQTWGIRPDMAHYLELSIAALALVLGSLHRVVEQITNQVLHLFVLDPNDQYIKVLTSQQTEPLLWYYDTMLKL